MTHSITRYSGLIAGAVFMVMAGQAGAADLPGTPPPPVGSDLFGPSFISNGSWYVRGDLGVGFSDTSGLSDDALVFGAGIGYRFNDTFRTDVTFDYNDNYKDNGIKADGYTIMLNGYADIPNQLPMGITPYIGAGVGWGELNASGGPAATRLDDNGFAYSLMAGLSVPIQPKLALDLGYKYREILINGSNAQDHLVRAGLRWSFN